MASETVQVAGLSAPLPAGRKGPCGSASLSPLPGPPRPSLLPPLSPFSLKTDLQSEWLLFASIGSVLPLLWSTPLVPDACSLKPGSMLAPCGKPSRITSYRR